MRVFETLKCASTIAVRQGTGPFNRNIHPMYSSHRRITSKSGIQLSPAQELSSAPTTDPAAIYKYRDSLYAADLVSAGLSLDFFTWLDKNPSTIEEICTKYGFVKRPVTVMVSLFAANDWIEERQGKFHTKDSAKEHLCEGSVWNLRPYYAAMHDRPIAKDFLQVLRTGKPAGWSGDKATGDWHKAMEQEDFARRFTDAMDCRGLYLAQALAERLDLRGRTRLLDIGAGSGVYACALAARNPHLTAVVFDQPPVDRIAALRIAERGCAARVSAAAGDMFAGLPAGCDAHLFSNVLHDWDEPDVRRLLAASRAALPAGGLLVVHDAILTDQGGGRPGPLEAAEYSCLLMHSTQGRCYAAAELAALLDAAGFEPGPHRATAAARGFVTGVARG